MHSVLSPANPFALMLDPQAIFDQIEHSERLERLQRRICRPLDKPLLPLDPGAESEAETTGPDSEPLDPAIDAGEKLTDVWVRGSVVAAEADR